MADTFLNFYSMQRAENKLIFYSAYNTTLNYAHKNDNYITLMNGVYLKKWQYSSTNSDKHNVKTISYLIRPIVTLSVTLSEHSGF